MQNFKELMNEAAYNDILKETEENSKKTENEFNQLKLSFDVERKAFKQSVQETRKYSNFIEEYSRQIKQSLKEASVQEPDHTLINSSINPGQ